MKYSSRSFKLMSVCRKPLALFILASLFSLVAVADAEYSPYVDRDIPMDVYWGDTHLHTNMSQDVGTTVLFSDRSMSSIDAYRFALGETITTRLGTKMRRQRPLDFLVIADHAENIGLNVGIVENNEELMKSAFGQRIIADYKEAKNTGGEDEFSKAFSKYFLEKADVGKPFKNSVWNKITTTADKYNEYENFTAFIGYEWTSWGLQPGYAGQLHRVVIFEDGAEKTQKMLPFSALDSSKPEDLWAHLTRYEQATGGDALVIPHNGNLSSGDMFALNDSEGKPHSQEYAKMRSRWEPLFEATQIKGDSETHPYLSPNDEFADYETYSPFYEKEPINERRQYEYARSGLKLGLKQQSALGINPFKFGMVGSTDSHSSMSAVAENNYNGLGTGNPSKERLAGFLSKGSKSNAEGGWIRPIPKWGLNAAGYAAVWAHENSRESLFAAMKRKEVYTTTGPRIRLRFFAGWDFTESDAHRPDLAQIGYEGGVPMGGDLTQAPKGKAPRFLIRAVKDPDGANLDRVQVIKGWLDKQGELQEKVYNVALSGQRKVGRHGKVEPVGSTVDVANARYTNTIGDPELSVVWQDPNFQKDELAFYYVRVLEIPTPRWTAYDAKFFGLKNIPKDVPMQTQERAYSSPVWYSPQAQEND